MRRLSVDKSRKFGDFPDKKNMATLLSRFDGMEGPFDVTLLGATREMEREMEGERKRESLGVGGQTDEL